MNNLNCATRFAFVPFLHKLQNWLLLFEDTGKSPCFKINLLA